MTAELQPLIDRIRTEAVEKAEQEAEAILAKAREKADRLVKDAEAQAQQKLEKADQDAKAFAERSTRTLEQAARDVLIAVQQGIENRVSQLVVEELDRALNTEALTELLGRMVESYVAKGGESSQVEVLVSEEDQEKLVAYFKGKYDEQLRGGLEVRADGDILKGFHISFDGGQVYHDFSREAMAEALTHFLRPHLAATVERVAKEAEGGAGGAPS